MKSMFYLLSLACSCLNCSFTPEPLRIQKPKPQPIAGAILANEMKNRLLQGRPDLNPEAFIQYPQADMPHLNKTDIKQIAQEIDINPHIEPIHNGSCFYFPCKAQCPEYAKTLILMNLENDSPSPRLLQVWRRLKRNEFKDIENYQIALTPTTDEETQTSSIGCGSCSPRPKKGK